jgi:RNA polymerase sigma factor (sigma-70 family)
MAPPLLSLRSDEQLVALFRAGHDEAFGTIHERYRTRLFAYTRQMLPRHHDAEDALQDVFVRVYTSLRANDRGAVKLRPWLYRAAHNRCIDELRRPAPASEEAMEDIQSPHQDPSVQVVEREAFDSLLEDIRRLPVQQRSALLMRELGGAHYADIALALGTTVPAVKSLLVRARITLASALDARDTACTTIREELTLAHDHRVRPNAMARAHVRDCAGCRDFRHELRGTSRQLAGLVPTLGPLAVLAKALGFGGAGGGASAGGGAAVVGGGALASTGALTGGHVATLIAAALVSAGSAVEIQNAVVTPSQSSGGRAAVISSPAPSVQSAAAPITRPFVVPPAASPQPPTDTPTATSTTSTSPSEPATTTTSPSLIPGPVRQPAITGIGAVSGPSAAPTSTLGHTSITGIGAVSQLEPTTTNRVGAGSATSGGSPSGSSGGGTGAETSGSSPASTSTDSLGGTTESGQAASSSSPQDSPQATDSSSSAASSSSTDSSSTDSSWNTTGTSAVTN